jgi:hypothetical protein
MLQQAVLSQEAAAMQPDARPQHILMACVARLELADVNTVAIAQAECDSHFQHNRSAAPAAAERVL